MFPPSFESVQTPVTNPPPHHGVENRREPACVPGGACGARGVSSLFVSVHAAFHPAPLLHPSATVDLFALVCCMLMPVRPHCRGGRCATHGDGMGANLANTFRQPQVALHSAEHPPPQHLPLPSPSPRSPRCLPASCRSRSPARMCRTCSASTASCGPARSCARRMGAPRAAP